MTIRQVRRGMRTIKPWVQRILDALDVFDWKTWVWYSLLGVEKIVSGLIVHAKRRGYDPGEIRLTKDKQFIVTKKKVS